MMFLYGSIEVLNPRVQYLEKVYNAEYYGKNIYIELT